MLHKSAELPASDVHVWTSYVLKYQGTHLIEGGLNPGNYNAFAEDSLSSWKIDFRGR
jgi:hypothetical protein